MGSTILAPVKVRLAIVATVSAGGVGQWDNRLQ
jgi:hypothetical protein